jgi:hypothetical protein
MRLILAVIQECDVDSRLDALRQDRFEVAQIALTDGFDLCQRQPDQDMPLRSAGVKWKSVVE